MRIMADVCSGAESRSAGDGGRGDRHREVPGCKGGYMTGHSTPKGPDRNVERQSEPTSRGSDRHTHKGHPLGDSSE